MNLAKGELGRGELCVINAMQAASLGALAQESNTEMLAQAEHLLWTFNLFKFIDVTT